MLQHFDLFQTCKSCTLPDSANTSVVKTLLESLGRFQAEAGLGANEYTVPKPNLLAAVWQALLSDFRIILEQDPAARNWLEMLCYYQTCIQWRCLALLTGCTPAGWGLSIFWQYRLVSIEQLARIFGLL